MAEPSSCQKPKPKYSVVDNVVFVINSIRTYDRALLGLATLHAVFSAILELRQVSFKYPGSDAYVLNDVSLPIPPGQRLAVVGPNGAGKTTFVKLLTRLYDPTEGEEYARLFSVVFQDFKRLSFSARDNITLGSDHDNAGVQGALRLSGLEEKVAGLKRGLETPVYKTFDEEGIEFSGGESQKLAIARAIFRNSPVVILDEPTAALDPVAEYEVYRHVVVTVCATMERLESSSTEMTWNRQARCKR